MLLQADQHQSDGLWVHAVVMHALPLDQLVHHHLGVGQRGGRLRDVLLLHREQYMS